MTAAKLDLRRLVEEALGDYEYVTPPHLRDSSILADCILARLEAAQNAAIDKESSTYIPLCGDHAATWFCERNYLTGGMDAECVVCAHQTAAPASQPAEGGTPETDAKVFSVPIAGGNHNCVFAEDARSLESRLTASQSALRESEAAVATALGRAAQFAAELSRLQTRLSNEAEDGEKWRLRAGAAAGVVVPREPTREMIDAAFKAITRSPAGTKDGESMAIFYRAMLSAAPAPAEPRVSGRQADKQVTLQASEYTGLVYNARRYEGLRDHMRKMPLGEAGIRYFFDQPGSMSFQEATDELLRLSGQSGAR